MTEYSTSLLRDDECNILWYYHQLPPLEKGRFISHIKYLAELEYDNDKSVLKIYNLLTPNKQLLTLTELKKTSNSLKVIKLPCFQSI